MEALNRAIDKVGFDKLDGPAVKAAMESLKDYSPMGLTYYTFSSSKVSPLQDPHHAGQGRHPGTHQRLGRHARIWPGSSD